MLERGVRENQDALLINWHLQEISQAEAEMVFVVVKAGVTSIHHAEIKLSIQSVLLLAAAPSRNFSQRLPRIW